MILRSFLSEHTPSSRRRYASMSFSVYSNRLEIIEKFIFMFFYPIL